MRSSVVGAKRRKLWLLAASCLAPLSLGVSEPALAGCAPPPGNYGAPGVTAICDSLPPNGNPYPGGINYNTDNGAGGFPIDLTLLSGVQVVIPAGPGSVNAVNLANTGGVTAGAANLSITADGVTIDNTANSGTSNNTGLRIQSSGAAIINATNTTIDVAGIDSTWAILAFAQPNGTGTPHDVSVN